MNELIRTELTESVIHELVYYISKSKEAAMITEQDAPVFLKQIVDGIMKTGDLLAKTGYKASMSRIERKRIEAISALEGYKEYLVEKGGKGTEAERAAFVASRPEVIKAAEEEAYWEAMYVYLQTVKNALVMTHDDVKKTVYTRSELQNRQFITA